MREGSLPSWLAHGGGALDRALDCFRAGAWDDVPMKGVENMAHRTSLTVIQPNDSHAYCDLHQEMFWQGSQAVYRPAGGYARIATIVKKIRAANQGSTFFCDCGDTRHGAYPAQMTQGEAVIPIFNTLGLDATTAHSTSPWGEKNSLPYGWVRQTRSRLQGLYQD
jgi:hypothetical protein